MFEVHNLNWVVINNRNYITCSTNCSCKFARALHNVETWFVGGT